MWLEGNKLGLCSLVMGDWDARLMVVNVWYGVRAWGHFSIVFEVCAAVVALSFRL